ncbi:MAG: hypothetical protein HY000_41370, partial [Planctomycetes bacterium]|nr:hypothetical protein [Planctomycetota bacterium]
MHLSLHPIWSWPLVAAGGVMLATAVAGIYRSTLAETSGGWRWLAFGLRLLALLMLVAAMLRPSLV